MIALDTKELEARLERRIAERVVAEITQLLANNGHAPKPADRWLSLRAVADRLGKSKRTIYNMVKAGEFPKRTVVFHGAHMWSEAVVEQWVREKGEAGKV